MNQLFFAKFLFNSVIIGFLLIAAALGKRMFQKHLTEKIQYWISLLAMCLLVIPFIPVRLVQHLSFVTFLRNKAREITNPAASVPSLGQSGGSAGDLGLLDDIPLNMSRSTGHFLSLLTVVWLLGIAVMLLLFLHNSRQLKQLKSTLTPVRHQAYQALFDHCCLELGIKKKIRLVQSGIPGTPFTFGLFKTFVVLPPGMDTFTEQEVRHIFLHELTHYKHKDILINYFVCLLRMLYWFHPIVWCFISIIRTEREINCDIAVLKKIDEAQYPGYGKTILSFAGTKFPGSKIAFVSEIGSSHSQLKQRIVKIAGFRAETHLLKLKSTAALAAALAIVFGSIPVLASYNLDSQEDIRTLPDSAAIHVEDLQEFFLGNTGAFVLYDSNLDSYTIFNETGSNTRYSPASTFKPYSALMALDAGIITPEHSLMAWDKTAYPFSSWNQDTDLASAMANSVNWYFQNIDQALGYKQVQSYLSQLAYGNQDISGGLDTYWASSSLQISPVEQVELLKEFYGNELKFEHQHIEAVKDAIMVYADSNSRIYGKTGTNNSNGKNIDGWFIGFIETDNNLFYFATHVQSDNVIQGRDAARITFSILNHKNICDFSYPY